MVIQNQKALNPNMKNTIYQCAQHLFGWFSSGAGFLELGVWLPVGVVTFWEAAERYMADGLSQDLTQWLGVGVLAFTLYAKIYNFNKKNKK